MTVSEIREIKKRFDDELSNFKSIYGCYVNAAKEIVSVMEIPVLDMDQEEREMYAKLFRKTVSGPAGTHLLDISFSPAQVESSDEHRLLMGLTDEQVEGEGLRTVLYEQIISNYDNDGKGYVILLAADIYDIRSRDRDEEWSEESETQFKYFVCSICGVKEPKPALRYQKEPKAFRGSSTGSLITGPVVGFMFPAFDERQANIYMASYYTKSTDSIHEELIEGLFRTEDVPSGAAVQKERLGEVLYESLGNDCTMGMMTSLQARLNELITDEEGNKSDRILFSDIEDILNEKGIEEEKIKSFREHADEAFSGKDSVSANSIIEKKHFRVTSSDAEIVVDPEQAVRLKTRKIDGTTYFLVPVGSDVRVNGMDVYAEKDE